MNYREQFLSLRSSVVGEWIIRACDVDVKMRLPHVDFPVYLQISRNLSEFSSKGGGKEEVERKVFRAISALPGIENFWDVGANIGQYSWEFLSLPGARSVILFEPDPRNAATIEKTIARSKLRNCLLKRLALSDAPGDVSFTVDAITGKQGSIVGGTNVERLMRRAPRKLVVACETVDNLVAERTVPPDLVKIDVEGAECRVLAGAKKTMAEHCPIMFLEVMADNFDLVWSVLSPFEYEIWDPVTMQEATRDSFNIIALNSAKHADALRYFENRT